MPPLLSIIVPCYNSARFIRDTVASVAHQTMPNWELILVDDGSSDETWPIISALAAGEKRIRIFRSENEGTCRARNRGFAASDAGSSFLFFLDHDDQVRPHFAELMCGYLEAHAEVGLVACDIEDISEEGVELGTGNVVRWRQGGLFPRKMREEEVETPFETFFSFTGRGPFAVYRRSVYARTTGWEVNFWPDEDTDMFCQMALQAKVHFLAEPLYLKRAHPGQASRDVEWLRVGAEKFRAKWDGMKSDDEETDRMLARARFYYYRRHLPYLNMITAGQAVRSFLRRENKPGCWGRFWENLGKAMSGVVAGGPGRNA